MTCLAPCWARAVRMENPEDRPKARAVYARLQRLPIREQRYALDHVGHGPYYDALARVLDVMSMSSTALTRARG